LRISVSYSPLLDIVHCPSPDRDLSSLSSKSTFVLCHVAFITNGFSHNQDLDDRRDLLDLLIRIATTVAGSEAALTQNLQAHRAKISRAHRHFLRLFRKLKHFDTAEFIHDGVLDKASVDRYAANFDHLFRVIPFWAPLPLAVGDRAEGENGRVQLAVVQGSHMNAPLMAESEPCSVIESLQFSMAPWFTGLPTTVFNCGHLLVRFSEDPNSGDTINLVDDSFHGTWIKTGFRVMVDLDAPRNPVWAVYDYRWGRIHNRQLSSDCLRLERFFGVWLLGPFDMIKLLPSVKDWHISTMDKVRKVLTERYMVRARRGHAYP
jgi:hypothetical protein